MTTEPTIEQVNEGKWYCKTCGEEWEVLNHHLSCKPTIEQMKQALRVAEEALFKISIMDIHDETRRVCCVMQNEAKQALTQISPILEKLEEGK